MSNWWDEAPEEISSVVGAKWWEKAPVDDAFSGAGTAVDPAKEGIVEQIRRRAGEVADRSLGENLASIPLTSLGIGQNFLRGAESGLYGLGGAASFLGGIPLGRLADAVTGGRYELADKAAGMTERYFDAADQAMVAGPNTGNLENQAASATGRVGVDLLSALLTGGGAAEARAVAQPVVQLGVRDVALQAAERAIQEGARASLAPSLVRGSQLSTDVLDAGGTLGEAAGAGATGAAANTAAYMLPGASVGSLPQRLIAGAGVEVPGGYLQQQAENLALPDRLGLDEAYSPRAALMDALLGGGLAGMTGAPGGPEFANPDQMRGRQAIEYDTAAPVDDSWYADAPVVEPAPAAAEPDFAPVADGRPTIVVPPEPASPPAAPAVEPAPAVVAEAVPTEAPARSAGPEAEERQPVFHGSRRNDIDRIQLDRSGTGSGEANYGFGAYFAGNREGADAIRQGTSSIARIPGGAVADKALTAAGGDRVKAAEQLRRDRRFAPEASRPEIDRALEVLRREPNRGTTYATEIPSDTRLLSWDEPLSAQPPRVQEALAGLGFTDPDMPGSRIYRELSTREGGQRQASDALSAAGIPGNRYRDGRGGQHYVVWDEGQVAPLRSADVASTPAPPAPSPSPQGVEPASPPAEPVAASPAAPAPAPDTTSTKNAVTDAERTDRGADPIVRDAERSNEQTLAAGREALAANPRMVDEIVARSPDAPISSTEEAAMLLQKRQEQNNREAAGKVLADPKATESQKTAARRQWDEAEAKIAEIDAANVARGTEWGRLGQFRQRLLKADFSLEAMESRMRRAKGSALTAEETASLRDLSERLRKAETSLEQARKQVADFEQDQIVRQTIEQAVRQAVAQARGDKKAGKPKLEALRERAEQARKSLSATESVPSRKGQSGAVISPAVFADLYHIGAYHVANGASKFGDWVKAMTEDLGAKFTELERWWPDIFAASKAEDRAYGAPARTPEDVLAGVDPENLTREDVRDLVMARIKAGEKDADAIMRAVTADLKGKLPEITEPEVRQLFADAAKRASPTRSEDARTLASLRAIVKLQAEIERVEAGGGRRPAAERQQASEEVRQLRARLSEALKAADRGDPQTAAALRDARSENLRKRIADLEDMIATGRRPTRRAAAEADPALAGLEARRDELVRELRRLDRPVRDPEAVYQRGRARGIANEVKRLQDRMAKGDYARRPRVSKALNDANKTAAYELDKLRREFRLKQFHEELKQRSRTARYLDNTSSGLNLARAVMTSFDLSGVLRQGGFITLGHPVRAAKGIPDMLKAFVSEKAQHAVQQDIESRPNAPLYKQAGLQVTSDDGSLSKMEEAYMTRFLDRLETKPGQPIRNAARHTFNVATAPVRGSGRAYTTFLNKLRADSFDAMAATLSKTGEPTPDEAKAIANYINVATGRGKVPGMSDSAAAGLNTVFFAPKLVASRFQLLAGQPLYGGSNRTRAMIAKDYARYMAGLGMVYALGNLARMARDPEDEDERRPFVELDPRSSSFGRMRFGDWFVDPLSGLAQVSTLLGRSVGGETKTAKGEIKPLRDNYRLTNLLYDTGNMLDRNGFEASAGAFPDQPSYDKMGIADQSMFDVLGSFVRSKLAPVPGAVVNTLTAENMVGQATTPGKEAAGLVTPMTVGNVADAMRDQGVDGGTALTLAEVMGMGVQFRDRASFDAPDYANLSFGQKRDYSAYLQRVQNIQQDVDELRQLANSFPDDTPPAEVRDAVQAKAEEMELGGVDLAQYKRKTTARDDRGARKSGLKRSASGNVEMEFADGSEVKAMLDAEKAVNAANKKIEELFSRPMSDEDLDKVYQEYFPGESAKGDKMLVARAIADERERVIHSYMGDEE